MSKIRLALLDDHTLFRQGLEKILTANDEFEVCLSESSPIRFLSWLAGNQGDHDILLLDLEMPEINGVDLLNEMKQRGLNCKIIILSMHFRQGLITALVEKGVNAYLSKSAEPEELKVCIHAVMKSGFYFNDMVLQALHRSHTMDKKRAKDTTLGYNITEREKEVLRLICRERSSGEIASELFLSTRTVEGHRNNLLLKSGAKNMAGLVLFAIRNGIIDPWFQGNTQ